MRTRCAFALLLFVVPAWAGKRIVMRSIDVRGETRVDILIDATRMRTNLHPNESAIFEVTKDRSQLVVLNPLDHTYGVLDVKRRP